MKAIHPCTLILTLSLMLAWAPLSVSAEPVRSCDGLFSVPSSLAQRVSHLRHKLVTKLGEPREFVIDGQRYVATYKLGASSTQVFLALDSNGRAVSIKQYPTQNGQLEGFWYGIFANEILKTNALISAGIETSPILSVDARSGLLVKEYTHGLQLSEIRRHQEELGLTEGEVALLENELIGYRVAIAESEPDILSGLSEMVRNHVDVPGLGPVQRIGIHPFDRKEANFLYDFAKKRWIFFDP